jgi:hypothetical protein
VTEKLLSYVWEGSGEPKDKNCLIYKERWSMLVIIRLRGSVCYMTICKVDADCRPMEVMAQVRVATYLANAGA